MKLCLKLAPVAALAIASVLLGGNGWGAENKSSAQAPKAVTVSAVSNLASALPIIAQKQGFFAEEGLEVKLDLSRNVPLAMQGLTAGNAHFATVVPINLAALGLEGNRDLRVIATIFSAADSAIVARRSAGISKVEDLRGKRIGMRLGSASQFFVDVLLAKHGLTPSDVQMLDVPFAKLQTVLADKEVDAVALWQPLVLNVARGLGPDEAVVLGDKAQHGTIDVAVKAAWLQEHQEEARAFLRALRKAELFVRDHAAQSQQIIAEQTGFDVELLKAIWAGSTLRVGLDSKELTREISDQGAWLAKTQATYKGKTVPDYSFYVDRKPFDAATKR